MPAGQVPSVARAGRVLMMPLLLLACAKSSGTTASGTSAPQGTAQTSPTGNGNQASTNAQLSPGAGSTAGSPSSTSGTSSASNTSTPSGKQPASPSATSPNTPVAQTPNVTPVPWPNVGFVNNPGLPGLDDTKAVALTFDDGPDGNGPVQWGKGVPSSMSNMLDQLDALGLKATFFLCGNLWTNALTDPQAQADIQRMVASGHAFGSHTLTHPMLVANTPRNVAAGSTPVSLAQVQNEFVQNEAVFGDPNLLGPNNVPFTMYRAPYGYPFQDGIVYPPNANSIVDDVTGIAPGTPYNAVHVGWGIDTDDWKCAQSYSDSNCILNNLNAFLDAGASGPILMHTVYKLSADTLPAVVASIYSHGYHIVMVEDFIKGKYGVSSASLFQANSNANFSTSDVNNAAVAAAMQSKWYLGTNEH